MPAHMCIPLICAQAALHETHLQQNSMLLRNTLIVMDKPIAGSRDAVKFMWSSPEIATNKKLDPIQLWPLLTMVVMFA